MHATWQVRLCSSASPAHPLLLLIRFSCSSASPAHPLPLLIRFSCFFPTPNQIVLAGTATDQGSGATVTSHVVNAHAGMDLPVDTSGIYLVLMSADVQVDGFCDKFCGYHTLRQLALGESMAVGLVAQPDLCGGCKPHE
ncbi:unnamed protein product [Closterium sp. NIES-64]|nr:unnamed protein product [Closterium sp. NIES-64]